MLFVICCKFLYRVKCPPTCCPVIGALVCMCCCGMVQRGVAAAAPPPRGLDESVEWRTVINGSSNNKSKNLK